jgi:RNA polymerase sigma-70 factor (ECF subfamily)
VDTMTAETAVEGYVVLDELPRPDGKLTKEQLDPFVAAARAGDPDAVQALLRLIKPTVVRYCRARIGGRDLS